MTNASEAIARLPGAGASPALPLPIASLLRKARNSEETKHRHDSAWAAWEASVRLAVAASPPAETASFALPSLGHWTAALPRNDDRFDAPELLAVAALLTEVATGKPSRPLRVTATDLCARLAPYRNPEVGHGAPRGPAFYGPAADTLLDGIERAWDLGLFWPAGATLVHAGRVEIDAGGARRARLLDLGGLGSTALGLVPVPDHVLPGRLYQRLGDTFRPLHPWLVYQPSDVRERVLFFNGIKGTKADYLDYATGDHLKSADLADTCPSLAADLEALFPAQPGKRPAPTPREPLPAVSRPARPRRKRYLLSLAIAILIATAIVVTMVVRREPPVPRISRDSAVQAELERAVDDLLEANVAGAEESFAAVAQRAPTAPLPHLGLSVVHALQDHFEEARAELAAAEKLAAGRSDREADLVHLVFRADEDLAGTLHAWEAYRRRFPRDFFASWIVAYFLSNRGTADERLGRYDAAIALSDRHAVTYLTRAHLLANLGRWGEAETTLAHGLALRPSSAWLLSERAVVRTARGDYPAARADFEQALAHGGPFAAHVGYAALLLNAGDEPARKAEVLVLQRTKSTEDRALFLCHHALALTRRGRAAESAALFEAAARTARDARKPGTILRCALLEAMAGDGLRRHAAAKARLAETATIFSSVVPMESKDAADGRRLVTEQRGLLHAELGELAEAREAQRELTFAGRASAELDHRLALAEHRVADVPEPSEGALVLPRVRRRLVRGRMLEQAGRTAEAAQVYARVIEDRKACLDTGRMADFPCGGHVAEAIVRAASIAARDGRPGEARLGLAMLKQFWPDADADLPTVKDASAMQAQLDGSR